jgi:hypothetical protein
MHMDINIDPSSQSHSCKGMPSSAQPLEFHKLFGSGRDVLITQDGCSLFDIGNQLSGWARPTSVARRWMFSRLIGNTIHRGCRSDCCPISRLDPLTPLCALRPGYTGITVSPCPSSMTTASMQSMFTHTDMPIPMWARLYPYRTDPAVIARAGWWCGPLEVFDFEAEDNLLV